MLRRVMGVGVCLWVLTGGVRIERADACAAPRQEGDYCSCVGGASGYRGCATNGRSCTPYGGMCGGGQGVFPP
jgi:hypothetical protein